MVCSIFQQRVFPVLLEGKHLAERVWRAEAFWCAREGYFDIKLGTTDNPLGPM